MSILEQNHWRHNNKVCFNSSNWKKISLLISLPICFATGIRDDSATGGRIRKLSVGQYDNDIPGQLSCSRFGWIKSPTTDQAVNPGSLIPVGETKEVNNKEFSKKYLLKQMAIGSQSHVHVQCSKINVKQLDSCIMAIRTNDCSYLRNAIQFFRMSCSCPLCAFLRFPCYKMSAGTVGQIIWNLESDEECPTVF